jgi:hypothetical protein
MSPRVALPHSKFQIVDRPSLSDANADTVDRSANSGQSENLFLLSAQRCYSRIRRTEDPSEAAWQSSRVINNYTSPEAGRILAGRAGKQLHNLAEQLKIVTVRPG